MRKIAFGHVRIDAWQLAFWDAAIRLPKNVCPAKHGNATVMSDHITRVYEAATPSRAAPYLPYIGRTRILKTCVEPNVLFHKRHE